MDAVPRRVPSRIRVFPSAGRPWLACWWIANDTIAAVYKRRPAAFDRYPGEDAQIALLARYRSRCWQEQQKAQARYDMV